MSTESKPSIETPYASKSYNSNYEGRSDTFWKTVTFLSPLGFIYAASYFFYWKAPYAALITLVHSLLFLGMAFFRRLSPLQRIWIHLGIAIYMSLFVCLSLVTGGKDSINIWWLITAPVVASNFLNRKEIILWSIGVTAVTISFFIPAISSFSFYEINPEQAHALRFASLITLTLVFTTTAIFSAHGRKVSRDKEQDALNTANRSANLAALGEMAGGIAHEINNPLMIISGSARVVEKSLRKEKLENEEKIFKHLETISKTVTRAGKIIHGLKTLSRDGLKDPVEEIVLSEVFDDVLSFLSSRFVHQEVDLIFDNGNPLLNTVMELYRVQFSQVVLNLLTNSFDAVSDLRDRWVKIELLERKNAFELVFTDSGKGIPDEVAQNIFTPFYTTKPPGKGTGLGLSLCNSIIEKCGGELRYEKNNPNTCFVVTLPKSLAVSKTSLKAEAGDKVA